MKRDKQEIYRNMILGVLLYSVVLGFFNDYTDILDTRSYSTTFAVAIVLQVLTFATLLLKDRIVAHFRKKDSTHKLLLGFSLWLLMFLSKFVFLDVIDIIFGSYVTISGFVGLLLIIISLTLVQYLVETVDKKLAK